jgi:predicted ATP-dependent serine protease
VNKYRCDKCGYVKQAYGECPACFVSTGEIVELKLLVKSSIVEPESRRILMVNGDNHFDGC